MALAAMLRLQPMSLSYRVEWQVRDEKVDLLRFVGLAMVVMAHVGAPTLLFQFRNFDVPLMVLLSGISFGLAWRDEPYMAYVWKRIKRLVFPVWIFLSAYFAFVGVTGLLIHVPDTDVLVSSYLLRSGIGYVWIIRIFLLVALVSPLILHFHRRTPGQGRYFATLGLVYAAYEALVFVLKPPLQGLAGALFEEMFLYLVPFAILFAIGLRFNMLRRSQIALLAGGGLLICAAFGVGLYLVEGRFVPTQAFKYPPLLYYLSYALGVSSLLWLLSGRLLALVKASPFYAAVRFMAQNSIWAYLWHIPLVEAVRVDFYLKFPLVFVLAGILTYLQVTFLQRLILPQIPSPAMRKNLNLVLTG